MKYRDKVLEVGLILFASVLFLCLAYMCFYFLVPKKVEAKPDSIYSAINVERTKHGLQALVVDQRLVTSAQNKCNDMQARNYFSHTDPSGDIWGYIKAVMPKYAKLGENIGTTSVSEKAMIAAWLNSPEHLANILDKDYSLTGIGVCYSKNYTVNNHKNIVLVVEHFAKP